MALWTLYDHREVCDLSKAESHTVAAADVLWSPDKTVLVLENRVLCVLTFFVSLFSLLSVFI